MDEFDVAKFLEDESLLAELVGDILQQLQTPFVEQRLANGFKEDLIGTHFTSRLNLTSDSP